MTPKDNSRGEWTGGAGGGLFWFMFVCFRLGFILYTCFIVHCCICCLFAVVCLFVCKGRVRFWSAEGRGDHLARGHLRGHAVFFSISISTSISSSTNIILLLPLVSLVLLLPSLLLLLAVHTYRWYRCLRKKHSFYACLGLRPSSRNYNPAPDLVLSNLIVQPVFLSGGVLLSQSPVWPV